MRKVIGVALVAVSVVLVTAAPAVALRDPFDPIVTSDDQTATGSQTTTTVEEPEVVSGGNPFSEGIPNTGADTSSWLAISYILVVFGGAAVVLARTLRPAPARPR
ncbi:MAG TPA: hypothetical protein VIG64_05080 [Actinomycetota bacterium]|jgi:hypothetical protein